MVIVKKRIPVFHILSFILPALVIAVSLASVGIYPGGEYTPLILDLRTEHLAFFNYINNISDGFNSLSFQSLGGLGGGVINSLQMYCGPAFIIFSFFDIQSLPWGLWWMIVCMIGLCGLAEFIYLKNGLRCQVSDYKALLFSVCYALMSCMVIYTIVPVWIWGGVFLPVIALGLDKVIDERKYQLFILSVTFAIIFDYYMAYILIVFSIVYFLYRVFLLRISVRDVLGLVLRCFACGFVSCMLSAFSWLPVLYDLTLGKAAENRTVSYGLIRNPLAVLLQLLPMSYDGLLKHSLPFIYCGIVPVVFIVLFFVNKKVSKREKTVSFVTLLALFLCFIIGALDIVWMFFAEPNGYPSRYSFVLSFMIILLAVKGSDVCKISFKPAFKPLCKCAVFGFVIVELYMNSVYLIRSIRDDVGPYSEYAEYKSVVNTMESIKAEYKLGSGLGRVVKNWRYTNDDGIMFGYPDIDYFSSCYNSNVHDFLTDLGLKGRYHIVSSAGITPVTASVLGVDTFIQYGSPLNDYYSYIGSADGLDIYHNDLSLPVAFSVNSGLSENTAAFGDNPFENINILMDDLCDSPYVFKILPTELDSGAVSTIPENGKHLWLYALPVYDVSLDIHSDDNGSKYYAYAGDMPICEYADSVSPFCVDLGVGVGMPVQFNFDKNAYVERAYMASYDDEQALNALSRLKSESAYDVYATEKGMIFSIDLPENKDIMLTLPYERGYSIYVDGIKTAYSSYRDALILIDAVPGHHDVLVTYSAPGLKTGCFISLISVMIAAAVLFVKRNKKDNNGKRFEITSDICGIIYKILINNPTYLTMEKQSSQRQSNFELLRVLAIIMVIIHHITLHTIFDQLTNVESINALGNAYFCNPVFYPQLWLVDIGSIFGSIADCTFILISGFFLAERVNKSISNTAFKLLFQSIFAAAVISVCVCVYHVFGFSNYDLFLIDRDKSVSSVRLEFFNESFWFIGFYFLIFVCGVVFLNGFLSKLSQKQYTEFLLAVFAIVEFSFTRQLIKSISAYLSTFLIGIFLYSLGGYIRKYDPFKKLNTALIVVILGLTLCCACFSSYYSRMLDIEKYFRTYDGGYYIQQTYIYNLHNVLVIVNVILLFELFKRIKVKYNKMLNFLGAATFMTYLIHDNELFYTLWYRYDWIKALFNDPFEFVCNIFTISLLTYGLGVLMYSIYKALSFALYKLLSKSLLINRE